MPNLVARKTSSRRSAIARADQSLVGVRPVHVGGVEEVAAELERAVDRARRLLLVGRAVERRHAHAAEADRRDLGPVRSERALLHALLLLSSRRLGMLHLVMREPRRAPVRDARSSPAAWRGARCGHNVGCMFPLNLPNLLTVLRIMLVPVLVVALLGNTPAGDVLAAIVFALASLTDFVDGYLARARDSITDLRQADGPARRQAADRRRADLAGLAAPPRRVGGDGDHHARAGGHGAAPRRHPGRRRDGARACSARSRPACRSPRSSP